MIDYILPETTTPPEMSYASIITLDGLDFFNGSFNDNGYLRSIFTFIENVTHEPHVETSTDTRIATFNQTNRDVPYSPYYTSSIEYHWWIVGVIVLLGLLKLFCWSKNRSRYDVVRPSNVSLTSVHSIEDVPISQARTLIDLDIDNQPDCIDNHPHYDPAKNKYSTLPSPPPLPPLRTVSLPDRHTNLLAEIKAHYDRTHPVVSSL